MDQLLKFKRHRGNCEVFPTHPMVSNWVFQDGQEAEAALAHCMAAVAEKGGLTSNDLQHLFPAVLRMLRSEILWANQRQPEQSSTINNG